MKKQLGGDRIGSGNKMEVDLRTYERSTHDLGRIWRSTMASGTLVPCATEIMLNGDTFDIELDASVMTHPTTGPLFGSFKFQIDAYQIPFRLYITELLINKQKVGLNMGAVKLPQIKLKANKVDGTKDPDNQQINPSCILSYLGIRGLAYEGEEGANPTRYFTSLGLIGYWDIYKNYYANQQEEIGAVIHAQQFTANETIDTVTYIDPIGGIDTVSEFPTLETLTTVNPWQMKIEYTGAIPSLEGILIGWDEQEIVAESLFGNKVLDTSAGEWLLSGARPSRNGGVLRYWRYKDATDIEEGEPQVHTFPLENLDDMRDELVKQTQGVAHVIDENSIEPYNLICLGSTETTWTKLNSQEGLAIKTYQSDKFNNWMQTDWIDGNNGINELTKVSTADGGFEIGALIIARKLYDVLNRVAVSGGTYKDWNETVYDQEAFFQSYSPIYEGGLSKEIVFQEVVSNASSEEGDQPLGTLAGRGVLSKKHKGGKFTVKAREAGLLMMIASITPRLDYSQGNKWDVNLKTMDDLHKPGLDQIGFQDLPTDELAWWDTRMADNVGTVVYKSAGKQPSWTQYMTAVNETRGNFAIADNEMFMTLNRRYELNSGVGIKDLTTYIDPVKFNHIFAQTSRDAQNFWVQIGIDIKARRKMSAKNMPNL